MPANRTKIFFLTSRFPFPLNKGDRHRAFNQIKGLSAKHDVMLFATHHEPVTKEALAALTPYCKYIKTFALSRTTTLVNLGTALAGRLPLQAGYFYSAAMHRNIRELAITERPDVLFCSLARTARYAPGVNVPRKVLDYMDAFSAGAARELQVATSPFRRVLLRYEAESLRAFERRVYPWFSAHTMISEQDARLLELPPEAGIAVVPNGVDRTEFFVQDKPKTFDLLFTGHMAYPPNIEAAVYAATRILPLVRQRRPETTLLIAGVGATTRVKALADEHVIVREHFAHIRDAFSSCRVMLAPMTISIGLQNKILQAFAMKLPVVASAMANEPINAPTGTAVRLAGDPASHAAHVLELLADSQRAQVMAEVAYQFVCDRFTWPRHIELLESAMWRTQPFRA